MSRGLLAGAAGSFAIDLVGYVDMARSGRSASETPSRLVAAMADAFGLDALVAETDEAKHRRTAVGAMLGYVNGLGLGAVHGMLHGVFRRISWPIEGIVLGLASTAATDLLYVKYDVADPGSYSASEWAYDIGFHVIYGLVTAASLRALMDER